MPRGGPRPGSGPPIGNLNAYKHGRHSRQRQRLLDIITQDPEALQLLLDIARAERSRRRQGRRTLERILTTLDDAAHQLEENNQTFVPILDTINRPDQPFS